MKHCMSGSGEAEHVPYSLRDGGGSWGALDNSYMAYTDRGASGVDVECTMPSRGGGEGVERIHIPYPIAMMLCIILLR